MTAAERQAAARARLIAAGLPLAKPCDDISRARTATTSDRVNGLRRKDAVTESDVTFLINEHDRLSALLAERDATIKAVTTIVGATTLTLHAEDGSQFDPRWALLTELASAIHGQSGVRP